jgi:uncharacterized protein (DUF1810 family)
MSVYKCREIPFVKPDNIIKKSSKKNSVKDSKKKTKKVIKKKSIERFEEAYRKGIKGGTKVIKNKREYKLDRNGVNYKTALKEMKNKKIKKKQTDYIWYIFPQPKVINKGVKLSETTKYFFITEDEVEDFLSNSYLSKSLHDILIELRRKCENRRFKLRDYFGADNVKFESFRGIFLKKVKELLDTTNRGNGILEGIHDSLVSCGAKK